MISEPTASELFEVQRARKRQMKHERSIIIDSAATRLYDYVNPDQNKKIQVSKAACLRIVERFANLAEDYGSEIDYEKLVDFLAGLLRPELAQ